jgi:hypothetical protein
MRQLLTVVHQYASEPRLDDSDAAAERDLDYFDRILAILGVAPPDTSAPEETTGEYRVRWEIDLDAVSHLAAARRARDMQLRPDSHATVFDVVLRTDTGEPDWHLAHQVDLTAHRTDQEVLDEIAHLLRGGEPATAEDMDYIGHLVQLTGRQVLVPSEPAAGADRP